VEVLSQEVKRQEREVSPLHSSSGEVKNLSTSIPRTFLHGADRQNTSITLTFTSNSSQLSLLQSHCFSTQPSHN